MNTLRPSGKFWFVLAALACLTPWVSAPVALLGGAAFAHIFGNPFARESARVSGLLLKGSVIGLGFGLDIHSALRAGLDGLWLTAASIALVFLIGYLVGGRLGLPRRISHLLSSGTAICGGSAIAAGGPAVRASAAEMSVALGVVFFLNSLALLIFPPLGRLLDFSQYQFGLWCAIAVHDTSSVVGAASAYGSEALRVAVTVKLARTLWIVPLTLVSSLLFKNRDTKIKFPVFILGFILAMLAGSFLPIPENVKIGIVALARQALVLCLFLIGAALSLENLRAVGWKPLALGLVLWLAISAGAAFVVIRL